MENQKPFIFEKSSRILSIDIFRGLTILVMVFVNDVAGVRDLPWWTYHIPPGGQGLTYVDVVFPAFLFIVGMAIPLAIEKRKARGDSVWLILWHILIRSLSLVAIGLLIMNGRDMDPQATGISYTAWNVLMFIGVILLWNRYPVAEGLYGRIFRILKWSGLLLLVVLLFIYRREAGGQYLWINPTNWSILGGIGWAYLSVSILFLLFRGNGIYLSVVLVMLVMLNVADKAGMVDFIHRIPRLFWPVGNGSLATISMSGLLFSLIFIRNDMAANLKKKIIAGGLMILLLFAGGFLLMPFGLAKIGSTPSYTLYTASISALVFLVMYWIVDVRGWHSWAALIKPAGSNPLLTYILPDIYYAIMGLSHAGLFGDTGWPGVLRAFIFTLFILGIATLMTRMKIRLQL